MYYAPYQRALFSEPTDYPSSNTLFVKDEAFMATRLRETPPVRVLDQCIRAKMSAGITGKPLKDPPSTYARPPKPGHSFSPQLHPLDRYYSSSNNTFAFFMSAASLSSAANNEKYASLVIR